MALFVGRFACSSEDSARRLANAILVAGLYPELSAPQLPGQPWSVAAPAEVDPTTANLAELQQALGEAATRSGAQFLSLQPGE